MVCTWVAIKWSQTFRNSVLVPIWVVSIFGKFYAVKSTSLTADCHQDLLLDIFLALHHFICCLNLFNQKQLHKKHMHTPHKQTTTNKKESEQRLTKVWQHILRYVIKVCVIRSSQERWAIEIKVHSQIAVLLVSAKLAVQRLRAWFTGCWRFWWSFWDL